MRLRLRTLPLAAALVALPTQTALADPGGPPAARASKSAAAQVPPGQIAPPPLPPPPPLVVDRPQRRALFRDGQAGRLLLGGTWYFRLDDAREGALLGFARQSSLVGWQAIRVPHNWNGQDTTLNRSSVGWYRKEFVLPRTPRKQRQQWVMRFEGASHRATVYLNGRVIGRHGGGYTPFEVDLSGLRRGRNRLVVQLSTLRGQTDLSHWRPARFNGYGTGGWWNFGGLSREVYVRPVRGLDVERVAVLPRLRCARCRARVEVRTLVRNVGLRARRVALALRTGRRKVELEPVTVGAESRREILTTFTIRRPKLWRLHRGHMYPLTVAASAPALAAKAAPKAKADAKEKQRLAAQPRARAVYRTAFGVRRIAKSPDGRVFLNGRPVQLRGASIHEDDPALGAALGPAQRSTVLRRVDELGADIVRAHYPLHPATLEALDRRGLLMWSQAPVYQTPEVNLARPNVRRNAVALNRDIVLRDRNHPSILTWSIGNELPEAVGPAQAAFIAAAASTIRRLDPTRLVAIDRSTRLGMPEPQPALGQLDALGVTEYFGWYPSAVPPLAASADADLGPRLDALRAAYPKLALFITEFGAESTRIGPESEKGTFDFQTRYLRDHLAIHRSRPFINGSLIWLLQDFRVHPTWGGGNPKPSPPWNHKGLLEEDGRAKPAFYEAQRLFRETPPVP